MELLTRKQALAQGLPTYSTGNKCKHGHDAPRYTSSGTCKGCLDALRVDTARNKVKRLQGDHAFTYMLHPEDVAAAFAYCQALDLQRGRLPSGVEPPKAKPVEVFDPYPHWVRIHGKSVADALLASKRGS